MAASVSSSGAAALTRYNAMPKQTQATPAQPGSAQAKAKAAAQEFEAVFLSTMFNQMFEGLKGDGPFGGAGGAGVWRSFLSDEYARSFAKSGGVGIADQVYSTLLRQQEVTP